MSDFEGDDEELYGDFEELQPEGDAEVKEPAAKRQKTEHKVEAPASAKYR